MPKPAPKLAASSTLAELAASPLLELLSRVELAVYVRLLVISAKEKSKTIAPVNRDLHTASSPVALVKALRMLEEHGLISIERDIARPPGRFITVR